MPSFFRRILQLMKLLAFLPLPLLLAGLAAGGDRRVSGTVSSKETV